MSECRRLRPLFYRAAEGELTPREAMAIAGHIESCTGCRIVLAKERRLGEILEHGMSDRIPVDDGFLDQVMSRLPEGPPPPKKRRFRIAAWLLPIAALTLATGGIVGTGYEAGLSGQPSLALGESQGLIDVVRRLVSFLAMLAGGVGTTLRAGVGILPPSLSAVFRLGAPMAVVLLMGSSVALLAARRLTRA